jgi:hypothetical protein
MTLKLRIARAEDKATREDRQVVLDPIEDARKWLATQGPDQWANPYPDADGKLIRVQEGIERGETWIVRDGEVPAGHGHDQDRAEQRRLVRRYLRL